MKKEDQVASLEPSKELKELGVEQDSIYYWWRSVVDGWKLLYNPATIYRNESFSAYTVAELGEMLPHRYYSLCRARIERKDKDWTVWICAYFSDPQNATRAKTEADARAKMVIHLIKEGIIEK